MTNFSSWQRWMSTHRSAVMVLNLASTGLLFLGKLIVGVLLLISAWSEPGLLNIGIGGVVGAFFLVQSLVRAPMMLGGLASARKGR